MPANQSPNREFLPALGIFAPAFEYLVDAAQRSVLFLDVMRQRGNQFHEYLAQTAPHVLDFDVELIADGRTLEQPVNYALVRVVPPKTVQLDPTLRPFVVIDPRAGHGPGIGGFKADSEIGVAIKAGHPCYFIGFLPEPMPGQTIEDVARAEAIFLEKVISLHPDAEGKPCVIGNCQAGWAVMMLAAIRPDLFGPIIVAGSPLSYWAGVRGQNPMRYTGGLVGGSWLTALTSDLGHGRFDGAWLVQNFENLNPSNTLWSKQYNLYAKIDNEASRYLGFERWWGGHVNMNAEEIQFIVDELFIGNNLAAGQIRARNGMTVDLRNIRSPIVVFCSKGDNITPPGQALGWILDLYQDVNEIRSFGQTIVYTVHETVGHLGIFVSSGVARKEHDEFSSNIDLIDTLPPGLYEAVFERKTADSRSSDLILGDWAMKCETRTLEDIRRMGGNDPIDDRCFATAARISEANLSLYRAFIQPAVRAIASAPAAEWMKKLHPLRLQYEVFSDANPLMASVSHLSRWGQDHRSPASNDNPFIGVQEALSRQIVTMLDAWRDARDAWCEQLFFSIYGSPVVQAMAGVDDAATRSMRKAPKSWLHNELLQARIADLRARIPVGGLREAVVRSVLYIGISRSAVDERGFEMVRRIRRSQSGMPQLPLADFKALVREQYLLLLIDPEASVAAIPSMLPADPEVRLETLELLKRILSASREIAGEAAERLKRIERLFRVDQDLVAVASPAIVPAARTKESKKVS
jgi:pimeloyl-ACP methyl ester carboxylesterase